MIVYVPGIRECPHTDPTNMSPTTSAGHMIASRDTLDGGFAAWAALYVMVLGPFGKEYLMLLLEFRTGGFFVVLRVTAWTDTNKTRWTL